MTAKEENLPLLQLIQDQGSSGTDQYFDYTFNIGEKNEFQIRVSGGQFGGSEPDEILANLAEYKKLKVQIFECPRADVWSLNPQLVHPEMDDRFSSQSWAQHSYTSKKYMGNTSIVSYLIVSPDTVCDIVHYCRKLAELKVFW
jgi:hypothetical protein